MKYYNERISVSLAKKLKERGMPMERTIHTLDSFTVLEDSAYAWLDEELGQKSEKVEKYYIKPKYADVFDWIMETDWLITIGREYDFAAEQVTERFEWAIEKVGCFSSQPDNGGGWCDTWYEAADAAIEKALELI